MTGFRVTFVQCLFYSFYFPNRNTKNSTFKNDTKYASRFPRRQTYMRPYRSIRLFRPGEHPYRGQWIENEKTLVWLRKTFSLFTKLIELIL